MKIIIDFITHISYSKQGKTNFSIYAYRNVHKPQFNQQILYY